MASIAARVRHKLATLFYLRNYYRSRLIKPTVSYAPIGYLPDGFTVNSVGSTGLRVAESFCSAEEAESVRQLVAGKAGAQLAATDIDRALLPLVVRGAMLGGFTPDCLAGVGVDCLVKDGGADALHVLLHLSTAEAEASATVFRPLNVAVAARAGRAVVWLASAGPAAVPEFQEGAEAAFVHMVFSRQADSRLGVQPDALQARQGKPLPENTELPDGVWIPPQVKA